MPKVLPPDERSSEANNAKDSAEDGRGCSGLRFAKKGLELLAQGDVAFTVTSGLLATQ